MEIKILLENSKLKDSNLSIEHGLSIFIEKGGYDLLFDTGGPEESAIKNALKLGIDLSKIDAVVISHGHNDHTGGLLKFLEINDKAQVYLKKEALNPHYSKRPEGMKYIGMGSEIVEKFLDRFIFVDKVIEITPDIFLMPQISKKFSTPSINHVLFTKKDEKLINDNFEHELFLIIKNNNDLVIFSGCGHSGIKNIISTAKNEFPDKEIDTVVGGFHLQAGSFDYALANEEEIEDIANCLQSKVQGKIYTGHCTGERGMYLMKSILKDRLERIYTGMKINF